MENRKILFFLPDVEGGVATVVDNLLRFIEAKGYSLHVILLSNSEIGRVNRLFIGASVTYYHVDSNKSLYKRCLGLKRFIGETDIIVSNDGGVELDTVRLFGLQNQVVYIMHGDFGYYYGCVARNINHIDRIITVSNYIKEQLASRFPMLNVPVANIYFPIPEAHYVVPEKKSLLTRTLKIIFVGALTERKGVHLFPLIVNSLNELGVSFEFSIIGEGPLLQIVKDLEVQFSNVRYLGQMNNEDVLRMLPFNDVVFLPSSAEGLPVVVVEGMKAGLVPVVSDIKSGIPELVLDGQTGFMVDLSNVEGFSLALKALYDNEKLMQDIKYNSKVRANLLFNPVKQASAYFSFMTSLHDKQFRRKRNFFELITSFLPDRYRIYLVSMKR